MKRISDKIAERDSLEDIVRNFKKMFPKYEDHGRSGYIKAQLNETDSVILWFYDTTNCVDIAFNTEKCYTSRYVRTVRELKFFINEYVKG